MFLCIQNYKNIVFLLVLGTDGVFGEDPPIGDTASQSLHLWKKHGFKYDIPLDEERYDREFEALVHRQEYVVQGKLALGKWLNISSNKQIFLGHFFQISVAV